MVLNSTLNNFQFSVRYSSWVLLKIFAPLKLSFHEEPVLPFIVSLVWVIISSIYFQWTIIKEFNLVLKDDCVSWESYMSLGPVRFKRDCHCFKVTDLFCPRDSVQRKALTQTIIYKSMFGGRTKWERNNKFKHLSFQVSHSMIFFFFSDWRKT